MEKIIRQLVIVIGAVLFSLVAHAANDTKILMLIYMVM